jgi:hypothetical protein
VQLALPGTEVVARPDAVFPHRQRDEASGPQRVPRSRRTAPPTKPIPYHNCLLGSALRPNEILLAFSRHSLHSGGSMKSRSIEVAFPLPAKVPMHGKDDVQKRAPTGTMPHFTSKTRHDSTSSWTIVNSISSNIARNGCFRSGSRVAEKTQVAAPSNTGKAVGLAQRMRRNQTRNRYSNVKDLWPPRNGHSQLRAHSAGEHAFSALVPLVSDSPTELGWGCP